MPSPIELKNVPEVIAAVGALGIASFGIVDTLGKTWLVSEDGVMGLPYVGFKKVDALLKAVDPAMKAAYGDDYRRMLRQQWRAGRSQGQAPESVRQGVRLGLPFLGLEQAKAVIGRLWGLDAGRTELLAKALTGVLPTDDPQAAEGQALAARFATALDARVQSAFDSGEAIYQTRAQTWAGTVAIALSLTYAAVTGAADVITWFEALLVGLVAVPLAPVAKDLASSLSDALGALGKIRGAGKP